MLWQCKHHCQKLNLGLIIKRKYVLDFNKKSTGPTGRRFASTTSASKYRPEDIRNLAIVAHIDSGKTTLTESILTRSGYLSAPGTVDTGSTTTDFLPAERERGITIQSASVPVSWREWSFNLVDTPGHADFGMEVESASRVVDGAVVLIDAVEGVESQTQGVWRQLDRYNVPSRILFMNKMDRPGASFRSSLQSVLSYRLHPKPVTLTLPVASFESVAYRSAEPGVQGIVDLVRWELWKFSETDTFEDGTTAYQKIPLPEKLADLENSGIFPPDHPLLSELLPARTALLEILSMYSEELMEELLALTSDASSYLSIRASRIMPTLRSATLRNEVLPVLCGSAMKHIGTDLVLDYAGLLLASPLDIVRSQTGESDVQMLAWKVAWDKRRGWMTFVRIYSGTLTRQTHLFNVTRNQKERISKLVLLYASEPKEVDVLSFGSIGVILGLKHTRTGDTLVSTNFSNRQAKRRDLSSALRDITPPPAVMTAAIVPQSNADLQPVHDAILALSRTDPSARVEVSEGQLLVHGLGALHLEIIEGRLRDEWGVAFEAGKRRVTYRESIREGQEVLSDETWRTELNGRPVTVGMQLAIRALHENEEGASTWDQNLVLDGKGLPLRVPDSTGQDNKDPWVYIAQGISSSLISSPHTSLPISRTRIEIKGYVIDDDVPLSVLAGASAFMLRKAIVNAGMGSVMEPFVRLKVSVTEEHFGKVIKDLTENGSELTDMSTQSSAGADGDEALPYPSEGVYVPPEWLSPSSYSSKSGGASAGLKRTIYAIAPLSRMLDFSNRLRAMSGGHGTFELANAGFRPVDEARKLEILKEIGRA